MKESLYYLFASGLVLGWGPCIGFCAPILAGFIAAYKPSFKKAVTAYFVFSAAKVFSYCVLGVLCGIFSGILKSGIFLGYTKFIGMFLGIFTLTIGLFTLFAKKPLTSKYCGFFSKGNLRNAGLLGLLAGFAPCLPLLGILNYIIIIANSPLEGALYAFTFGLATTISPIILLVGLSGKLAGIFSGNKTASFLVKLFSSLTLIFIGLLLTFR